MAFISIENFDSYSNGDDLKDKNGGSDWTSAWTIAHAGRFFVSNSSPFQGTECVTATAGNDNAFRSFTAISAGVVYFAMKRTDTTSTGTTHLGTSSNSTPWVTITFESGNIIAHGNTDTTLVTTYSTSTWYVFEITIIDNNHFSVRTNAGAGWSASTGSKVSKANSAVDGIILTADSAGTVKWDDITPTNPYPEGPTSVKTWDGITQSTAIKTYFALAVASVKSVMGVT